MRCQLWECGHVALLPRSVSASVVRVAGAVAGTYRTGLFGGRAAITAGRGRRTGMVTGMLVRFVGSKEEDGGGGGWWWHQRLHGVAGRVVAECWLLCLHFWPLEQAMVAMDAPGQLLLPQMTISSFMFHISTFHISVPIHSQSTHVYPHIYIHSTRKSNQFKPLRRCGTCISRVLYLPELPSIISCHPFASSGAMPSCPTIIATIFTAWF
jgi:hypothetical protein